MKKNIEEVAQQMCQEAAQWKQRSYAVYKGIGFWAAPGDTAATVLRRYYELKRISGS